jgi:hypothetical protein
MKIPLSKKKKKKKEEKIRSIMGSFGRPPPLSLSRQVAEGDKGQHATTTAAHR